MQIEVLAALFVARFSFICFSRSTNLSNALCHENLHAIAIFALVLFYLVHAAYRLIPSSVYSFSTILCGFLLFPSFLAILVMIYLYDTFILLSSSFVSFVFFLLLAIVELPTNVVWDIIQ